MIPNLDSVFDRYKKLRDEADAVFTAIKTKFPDCVKCAPGCDDCCHALFDLSLVEAMYLNQAFHKAYGRGRERSQILERASEVDRGLTRLKREMFRAERESGDTAAIMARAAGERVRCPLLGEDRHCLLYEERPITCRLYGIPLDIGGKGHVCGFSGFIKGRDYPSVQVAKIQGRLENLTREIAEITGSRFELSEVYVPLSMALLTRYDDSYLGIGAAREED